MPTITICGLGPGGSGRVTEETAALLADQPRVFLRTARHPGVETLIEAGQSGHSGQSGRVTSFDHVYEQAASFDEVYRTITDEVLRSAHSLGQVVYAVPGSPLVLERSVRHLRAADGADGITIELLPAISFLDDVWARLSIDPVDDGVRMVDGLRFATDAADQRGPLLVAHAHAQWVLSDIKLALDVGPEQKVVVLQRLGTDEERIFEVAWPDLDRVVEADHLTSLYIPELAAPVGLQLARSVEMMKRLRRDCPWDQTQTHRSLRKYLIEEAYEVLDAIDGLPIEQPRSADRSPSGQEVPSGQGVPSGEEAGSVSEPEPVPIAAPDADGYVDLEEELGDLLFQILFHCELASEAGQFTIAEVAEGLTDKMIRRHPHVYGDGQSVESETADGSTVAGWEQLKLAEKGRDSVLDGIPRSLPALALAEKTLKKADGKGATADLGPLEDHLSALLGGGADPQDDSDPAHRVGQVLLAMVEVGRRLGVDSELALRQSIDRAGQRFRTAEATGESDGLWVRG